MKSQKTKDMQCKCFDDLVYKSLRQNKKVTLFLCKDEEGGFGVKIDGKVVGRNFAWEVFEYPLQDVL